MRKYSPHILCYDDFCFESVGSVNEATQDTVLRLQEAKSRLTEKAEEIKKSQSQSMESMRNIQERSQKTKDAMTLKIYQARVNEEKMKQQLYTLRMQAVQQSAKIIDQKLTVANLRLQAKSKKQV